MPTMESHNMHDDLLQQLRRERYLWYGQRGADCYALSTIVDIDGVLCCDFGQDIAEFREESGTAIVSMEVDSGRREAWSNFSLDNFFNEDRTRATNILLAQRPLPAHIVAYAATGALDRFCRGHENARSLSTPLNLRRQLDDKLFLRRCCSQMGIPSPDFSCRSIVHCTYEEFAASHGEPIVIQARVGASGKHTHFVYDQSQLDELQTRYGNNDVIVTRFYNGPSLNVTAVVGTDFVEVAPASIQINGEPTCVRRPEYYCGNDFGATSMLPPRLLAEARTQVTQLGRAIQVLGYRGIFGVDLVTEPNSYNIYAVDLNPRLQGSTDLLTQLELLRGTTPLVALHLAVLLGDEDHIETGGDFRSVVSGAQLHIHSWLENDGLVHGHLQSGVYSMVDGQLTFRRKGRLLEHLRDDREFLIVCGVPMSGTRVAADAPLLKIQTMAPILSVDGTANNSTREIVQLVREALQLEPVVS
jgi:ATP-grasp domain